MGNSIWKRLCGKKEKRIVILGLDASGKTSTLYTLKLGKIVTTIPTIGSNVESISHNGVNIMAWDVGGGAKIRPLYRHYYKDTEGLVYVIDSNDRERYIETVEEMMRITYEDELRNVPILILANKQDLPNAMSPHEIANKLFDSKRTGLQHRPMAVFGVSVCDKHYTGLLPAFDWLTKALTDSNLQPRQYVQDWNRDQEETKPAPEVEHRKSCGLLHTMKS